jgi:hypothetical protein
MAMPKLSYAALAVFCLSAVAANVHPGLNEVKRVYLLPMTSGLDQYLANQLTRVGRFEVVTDPANADAIFTDRLGPSFEQKWNEMYPPPPPPEEAKPANDKTNPNSAEPSLVDGFAGSQVARISSFSRGRGNIFLVSRKDGAVLWSHFKVAKKARAEQLDDTAEDIAERLHKHLRVRK